jgi:hypothetical protein
MTRLAAVICSLILAACAAPFTAKLYEGPELPADQVSTVAVDMSLAVLAVDGADARYNGMTKLNMLPGQHTMSLRYSDGNHESKGFQTIKFSAQPGKTYKVNSWRRGLTWGATVTEVGTNK